MKKCYLCNRVWEITRQEGLNSLLRKGLHILNNDYKTTSLNYEGCHKLFIKSALARSQGDARAGEDLIYNAFNSDVQNYHGLCKDYINDLLYCIEKRQISQDLGENDQEILIQHTKELHPLSLPCKKWLALYYVCIRSGLLRNAFFLRQKAAESAYRAGKSNSIDDLCLAFRARIDAEEFHEAQSLLDNIKKRFPAHFLINDLESYYKFNIGDIVGFRKLREKKFDHLDLKFKKFIEGNNVAIVGPAPSCEENGEEIDSFDVVIRISYRGRDRLPERCEFGERIDISYYGDGFSTIINESEKSFLNDLEFAVFKSIRYDFQKQLIKTQRGRQFKKNTFFFNGSPLEINNTLFDILHFNPANVKLFRINFYLSNNPYYNGYCNNNIISFAGLAHHDVLSNINFTRNIRNAGLVEVDNALEKVINLTTFEYCSSMENIASG